MTSVAGEAGKRQSGSSVAVPEGKTKRQRWTAAETDKLKLLASSMDKASLCSAWADIAARLGTGRSSGSVSQRWYYLNRIGTGSGPNSRPAQYTAQAGAFEILGDATVSPLMQGSGVATSAEVALQKHSAVTQHVGGAGDAFCEKNLMAASLRLQRLAAKSQRNTESRSFHPKHKGGPRRRERVVQEAVQPNVIVCFDVLLELDC